MEANIKIQDEITKIFDDFFELYLSGKLDELMDFFITEPDVTMISAGSGEKKVGPENIKSQFKENFSRKEKIVSMGYENLMVSESEKEEVVWVSSDLKVQIAGEKQEVNLLLRLTGVLVKRDNKWKIAQMHSSAPFNY
jgi:hypothetical protein